MTGDLVHHAGLHVLHQSVIGDVTDLVHRIGRDFFLRILCLVLAEFVFDARQPLIELFDRARFSAGNEPTMPALHWAMTNSGPEAMNRGAPSTGSSSRPLSKTGSGMVSPFCGRR
jgi:hypothetical protein